MFLNVYKDGEDMSVDSLDEKPLHPAPSGEVETHLAPQEGPAPVSVGSHGVMILRCIQHTRSKVLSPWLPSLSWWASKDTVNCKQQLIVKMILLNASALSISVVSHVPLYSLLLLLFVHLVLLSDATTSISLF